MTFWFIVGSEFINWNYDDKLTIWVLITSKHSQFLQVDVDHSEWKRNQAGLYHSHKHGFGVMKAWRLVSAAKVIVTYTVSCMFCSCYYMLSTDRFIYSHFLCFCLKMISEQIVTVIFFGAKILMIFGGFPSQKLVIHPLDYDRNQFSPNLKSRKLYVWVTDKWIESETCIHC